ncbi:hypothetical protein C8J25_101834 [Sphingomonas faeni]|uniref:Uncharacterized protein n=1 Tax=Sphingomonas faeni TaxID=185950 RepID=A0A2T5UCU6_9SPHN|nr:hypothetical protein [Sphingomonas faeni]PTW49326.1 hypothetical protein C8J25_101834 [Sphingomonas faeni]
MSFLEKLNALIDPKLKETFERKAYDPAKDRKWLVGRLEASKTQFGSTETTRGGGAKWWKLANGVVAFSPTRSDKMPLVVNGQTTLFIPSEHFVTFVDHMIAAVNAGEFDKELTSDTTNGTTVKVRVPRKAKEPGAEPTGWSAERRAKFDATMAARKAG